MSSDTALGIPYNIASYAALLHIVAYLTDLKPGRLIGTFGDVHLYLDHIEEGHVSEILTRELHPLPTMDLSGIDVLEQARETIRDFKTNAPVFAFTYVLDYLFVDNGYKMVTGLRKSIKGYKHGKPISMNVSV